MTPKEYSAHCQLYAKSLAAEGWSQTAISKELRVPRENIRNWLKQELAQKRTWPNRPK
jgi:orotate phosphoribosyltransferase-like protein